MALRRPLKTAPATSSGPGLVTNKTLTLQDREMMLAYAEEHPRLTHEDIAKLFGGISRRTVSRTLLCMRKRKDKRPSIVTQLGHEEDVPNDVANASLCLADMRGEVSLPDDSGSALSTMHSDAMQNEEQGFLNAVTGVSLQSSTCGTQDSDVSFFAPTFSATISLSFNQHTFDHHTSIDKGGLQACQSTAIPTFQLWKPDSSASVPCQLDGSLVVPSQTFVPPADRSMAMEDTKPPQPPRDRSSSLPTTQHNDIRPGEAFKALRDVIEYCMRQPPGFLDLREGVILGKLSQRLDSLAVGWQ